MIRTAASTLYGAVARTRRRWYTGHPSRQRHLARPVVSVGNLTVGGTGKTPVVAHLARLLTQAGERPAILSRGYARRIKSDGVTVVSDLQHVLSDVDHAGDEPLMLARALPGVPVLVGADRYLSGRFAESRFDATVHLLDDGFQHLTLGRDVNLLLVDEADLTDRVVPAGRLREPVAAAGAADAVLLSAGSEDARARIQAALGVPQGFHLRRTLAPVLMTSSGKPIEPSTVGPVFAVAGIARPQRLFDDLTAAGWRLGGTMAFRDHHRFTQADVTRIANASRDAQTHIVVTTAKDAVRLEPLDCSPLALAVAPVAATIEPAPVFYTWLLNRLAHARERAAGGRDTIPAGSPRS